MSLPDLRALTPEVAHALGMIALARGLAVEPRVADLDPAVRAPWDCALLALDPSASMSDEALERALASWPHDDVPMPARLIARCAAHPAELIALAAITGARAAVRAFALAPRDAIGVVEPLAKHSSARCRWALARALRAWPTADRSRVAATLAGDTDAVVVRDTCPSLFDLDLLRGIATRSSLSSEARAAAWARLAALGDHETLAALLELPTDDPCVRWGCARAALVAFHRRGVFVRETQISALLAFFGADPGFEPETLVRLIFTCRHAFVRACAAIDANDPLWARLAPAVAECEGDGATELACERLGETSDPEIVDALLRASRRARDMPEQVLLGFLTTHPEAALEALALHGTEATVRAIVRELADPLAFGAARAAAVHAAWRTTDDRVLLADRLDPLDLDPEWLRAAVDPRLVEILLARLADAPALVRLETVARVADRRHASVIEALFREALQDELRFDPRRRPRGHLTRWEAEEAAAAYGAHLVALGRRFSPWAPESADELLRVFALRWLDEAPSEDVEVALLGILRRARVLDAHLPKLHRRWRDRRPTTRRAAMEMLLDGADAGGLELSLCQLAATADDEPTLRQALRAIGVLDATWAEPFARAALEHPNMNVKKTAAEALAVVGDAESVEALIGWLSRHDNPGLRVSLLAALDRAAGDAADATLFDAWCSSQGRSRELLTHAFDRRLGLADLRRLVHRDEARELVDAALAGALTLHDATASALRDALGLDQGPRELEAREAPALDALTRRGFSLARAQEAVAEAEARGDHAALDAAIRGRAPEWITAALDVSSSPTEAPLGAAMGAAVLRALEVPTPHDAAVVELIARHGAAAPSASFRLASRVDVAFREAAIAGARALPPTPAGGLSRWNALGALGAIRTRDDVARCVDDARLAGVEHELAFLTTALGLDACTAERARDELSRWWDERPRLQEAQEPARAPSPERVARWLRDPVRAAEAALQVLARADLRSLLPEVLSLHLDGALALHTPEKLGPILREWPSDAERAARAVTLLASVPAHRRRAFAPGWLEAWTRGEAWASDALASLAASERVALVADRVAHEPGLADVLALGVTSNVDRLRLASFLGASSAAHAGDQETKPTSVEEWLDEARRRRGRHAARAVRALADAKAIDALVELASHADAHVRRAALRHLRKLAPKERYYEVATATLEGEPRAELRRTLVRSLGHARHRAALPRIVELVLDPDASVARAARDALIAVGEPARALVIKARARARPDRRAAYDDLVAKLT
ncbi:MAG: HEAT repeat domain-containing protein [Myxococcales bacterium]|nr:HEAT repeat domain-containing protein [Myxococcales bacterium]